MKRNFTILNSFKAFALLSICFLMGSPVFAQTYCTPNISSACSNGSNITNVTMGYINNSYTGCSQHDFTNMVDTVYAGVPKAIGISTEWFTGYGLYVDLDNNGDFNGLNEWISGGYYAASGVYTYNETFVVPATTATGLYRIRVVGVWGWSSDSGQACLDYSANGNPYGTYQDYSVYVEPVPCPIVDKQPQTQTACTNDKVRLTVGSSVGGGFTYTWMQNGNVINGATDSVYVISMAAATDAGVYSAVVTDACGSDTSQNATLTVSPLPTVSIIAAGSTIYCPGSSVILNTVTPTGTAYQWFFNGDTVVGATGASYNAMDTGSYTVSVYDGCTGISIPTTTSFYVVPAPVLTPSGLVKICIGTTKTIVDNSVPGETYKWVKDGNIIPGATSPTYIVSATGNYTIIATDIHSCSDTAAPANVLISPPPPVNVAANGNNTILCQGATLQLNASSTDTGEAYQWQMAGSDIPGATGPVYMAAAAGNYSVVGFNGCYVTSSTITLTSNPFPDVIVGGPLTFCSGSSVSLQSSISGTNGLSYQWMKDGSAIDGATGTTYTANTSGSYTIVVTSNNTCAAASTPVTVTANPLPQPIVTTNPNNDLTTTLAYGGYQWYMVSSGTGTPISNANAYSYTAMANGSYYVAVTDDNGCTGQSGNFVVSDITRLGISNISEALKVYPNPASSYVHIASPVPVNVYVSAMDGRVVLQQNNAVNMDISGLADGVYMMRITDADGNQLKVEKLVKQAR